MHGTSHGSLPAACPCFCQASPAATTAPAPGTPLPLSTVYLSCRCCSGSTWRTLRSAWQPAFSPAALASYLPATEAALDRLISRLGPASDSGEVVDLSKELTALTLDIVGQAAYG